LALVPGTGKGKIIKIETRSACNGVITKVQATAEEDGEEIVRQQMEGDDVEAFAVFLRFSLTTTVHKPAATRRNGFTFG
jgi:hypothetical protein